MPRIKVSFTDAQLEALKVISADLGIPVANLVANAAIEQYLSTKSTSSPSADLRPVLERLSNLETLVRSLQPKGGLEGNPTPKYYRKPKETVVSSKGRTIFIDDLLERLFHKDKSQPYSKKDWSAKARLYQLGGRDGSLFQGDLGRAKKVASYTASHDPEGLSWLPKDTWRQYWVQMSAEDYVRAILNR